ncbi:MULTISPECIES: DEAD/DEAH box helicase [Methylobacterium]|uniref:UvrABC system protein B n=1 Tax=Methylobacterium isbiliense TaxID=315478 RepID=A0ABQ4S6X3_9HYPH|nr:MULTISPECIES: DEAD/DEAH box helicase family protein [Methylobacterium]MBY0297668.1 DEAD/DEAH box helicase family protein [Methylobacterium sp.]MDN3625736.1 DEAD/DEAH box helicase family protein [Methylobacterium isbiliense]GJD98716.1 UvrABC system protein B [Methylobacterium isbiliense]
MSAPVSLQFPPRYAASGKVLDNPIRQLAQPSMREDVVVEPFGTGRHRGHVARRVDGTSVLIVPKAASAPAEAEHAIHDAGFDPARATERGVEGNWIRPAPRDPGEHTIEEAEAACREVLASFRGRFTFREERRENGRVVEVGLRPPQTGALYAILAHWKVSTLPATVVMPTGTGKTETMLAVMAWERLPRLLAVVPGDALRDQIGDKFTSMGLLRELGILGEGAGHPHVGLLRHMPKTPDEVDRIFRRCNVVVATMAIAGRCSDAVKARMAELCSHLFIDEAHHIPAKSWDAFRQFFAGKPVVQFTATPFRRDGKHVDGRIVFNYPLRKAQAEGYFKPIGFLAVDEIDRHEADVAIACAAIDRLDADIAAGFRHLVMARADDVKRAEAILAIYTDRAPGHEPRLIHSGLPGRERTDALRRLRSGETRIVVCVDMLGEGFDLPELKIAAIHDPHKSLAITLQFTGRFTRYRADLGDATMIANIADPRVEEALRSLFAEDADWNVILRNLSEGATGRQARRSELLEGFGDVPEEVSLRNIAPKMSAVVYRTSRIRWSPDRFADGIGNVDVHWGPVANQKARLMLFITEEHEPVPWGDIRHLRNKEWHLYVLHWDEERKLLFINSSNNGSDHFDLAAAVCGQDVELIKGERIFRSLHGITRLVLNNLGLSHVINQNNRFSMHVGADISDALPEATRENKKKSNLFGSGFENGGRVTAGCSQKGRVWSYRIAYDLAEWIEWCHQVGAKLVDDTISTARVFDGVILPKPAKERPPHVPIVIEWPEAFLERPEDLIQVEIDGTSVPFFEASLDIVDFTDTGPIRFRVAAGDKIANYVLVFRGESVEFVPDSGFEAELSTGRRRRTLTEWFRLESPVVRFANGASLEHNELYELPASADRRPYDRDRIVALDWTGVDIRKESQTQAKLADSIQRHMLDLVLDPAHDPHFEIVFDDDDAGEAADIVCIRVVGNRFVVHLYHCKYSSAATAGARVDDLYAVCGQTQRSVRWRGDVEGLLLHLRHRDELRRKHAERRGTAFVTRFERGDAKVLQELARKLPFLVPEFRISIVQPGLSRADAGTGQLELLAVTETYLKETYGIAMEVIASA